MKSKIFSSFSAAISDIPEGATIMMHCLMGPSGVPQNLILALRDLGVKNLTIVSPGFGGFGGTRIKPGLKSYIIPNILVDNGQVKKAIIDWSRPLEPGIPWAIEEAFRNGEIDIEPVPQGTLAERIRAGGVGLGGFYSPVGIGTIVEAGKERKTINGKEYILELPLRSNYAFIRAYKADKFGNLIYKGISRAFNPLMAMAADVTIAEVDEIVDPGELNAESIITPSVFVDRIIEIPLERKSRM